MSLTKNLQIIDKKGYLIFENVFSKKSTKLFKSKLEKILIVTHFNILAMLNPPTVGTQ